MTMSGYRRRRAFRSSASWLLGGLGLFAAGCLVTGGGSRGRTPDGWVFDSMSGLKSCESLESRTWTDEEGFTQHLDLCRSADRRFYLYQAHIAVCGSVEAVCKPHRFDMAFDETGGFLGYRVERAHPFTKAAHDPFDRGDYAQLHGILANSTHPLADLPAPRRAVPGVRGEGNTGIDAVTGATVSYYADHAVPKAFYTTHAIWHLANRSAPERVQAWTLAWADAEQARDWLGRGEALKCWWFIDHLEKSALSKDAATDLAYEMLSADDSRIQTAALRYLRRTSAPFRPTDCRGTAYSSLPEDSKTEFLDWWMAERYADAALYDALRADLESRTDRSSPVAAAILKYLQRTGLPSGEAGNAWRRTLRLVAEHNPSTYLKNKAWQLMEAGATPGP